MSGVSRATIHIEDRHSIPIFERTFSVTWDPPGGPGLDRRLKPQAATELAAFVADLRRGAIDSGRIRKAASELGSLLGTIPLAGADLIELVSDGTSVLTEVPWEAAAMDSGPLPSELSDLVGKLLASLPICRLVPGAELRASIGGNRPRLLLCISNPPGFDGGQIAVAPVAIACEQTLQLYSVFEVKVLARPPTALIWPTVESAIRKFQPNVLIMVGHGSSNPTGGNPRLAFVRSGDRGGVDWVPVAELAKVIASVGSCCLVALIACDLVRDTGYSAACEIVQGGVNEVVAMQGSVEQQCARAVLVSLLAGVLAGLTLPTALAAARLAARAYPHAILPAAFRAAERGRGPSELAPLSTLYNRALGALHGLVHEKRGMFKRPRLEEAIENLLCGLGAVAVASAYGNGGSTVLRAAVASLLNQTNGRRSRPIIYIDCDLRPRDLPLSDWVADRLLREVAAHPVLRPKSSPDFVRSDGEAIGTWALEAEISVVLDNLPNRPLPDEQTFVRRFSEAYRPDGRACLVLGGAGELLNLAGETVEVSSLSREETEQYVLELIPGADAHELYAKTGGTLLLLEVERRIRTGHPGIPTMTHPPGDIVDQYIQRLESWLSADASEAAHRLSLFSGPVDSRLVEKFVAPDLPGSIEELLSAGLATPLEESGAKLLLIPEQKAYGLQTRWEATSAVVEETLASKFCERYEQNPDGTVREIASLNGASTYFHVVQRCLAESGRSDVAVALPILAQGTPLRAVSLFKLFEQSVEILDQAEITDEDVLLAGSRVALSVGEANVARQWFGRIPTGLGVVSECRRLGLMAVLLKDQQQRNALDQILACLARISELMSTARPEEQQEFDELRKEIAFDSLPTALFLNGEPAASAASRLDPLLPQLTGEERAHLLATLSEREMKEPAGTVNWTRVAEWITDAGIGLDGGSDDRVRTYCLYQQAQYLRMRPEPKYSDAWRAYEDARAAGERAGEPRREGLALLRLVELERKIEALRNDSSTWPAGRLSDVDKVAARLELGRSDALSMRVLGRLQSVAALIDPDRDSRRNRLTGAARALSAAVLGSRGDNRRFAEVCAQALELDLEPEGDHLLALRFLQSFRRDILRRFGIAVDLAQPEKCRGDISKWLKESM